MDKDQMAEQEALNNAVETDDTATHEEDLSPEALKYKELYENQKKRAEKAEKKAPKNSEAFGDEKKEEKEKTPIDEYVEKYGGDPDAIAKIAEIAKGQVSSADAAKIAELEEKLKRNEFENKFDKLYSETIKDIPEGASVVNKNLIKKLVLDPDNSDKTMADVINDVYGDIVVESYSSDNARSERQKAVPKDLSSAVTGDAKEYAEYIKSDKGFAELKEILS